MKNNIIQFGEQVPGYSVPVLNEREIRAAAGIVFVLMLIGLMLILFRQDFLLIKYLIILFFSDLVIRVFINPRFSPALILGRLIVSRQSPEYVSAPQKKFAWKIGLVLSGMMLVLMVVLNSYSIITGLSCLFCLAFLFFETSFGICLGCLVYKLFYKNSEAYCSGDICRPMQRQAIQRTSWLQFVILLAFAGCIILLFVFLNTDLSKQPVELSKIFVNVN